MKKSGLLVMPLIAVSLLASCGGNKIPDLPKELDLYKKATRYQADGKTIDNYTVYEYDKNLKIKESLYNSSKDIISDTEYTYDEHGNLTEKTIHSYTTTSGYYTYTNTYDNQNRLIKVAERYSEDLETWYDGDTHEYIYDKHSITDNEYDYVGLVQSTVYTFDDRGCLINVKADFTLVEGEGVETVFDVNEYGCATTVNEYNISEYTKRELTHTMTIEYLDNLWYRPTKMFTEYIGGVTSNKTQIYEYNDKQQITRCKLFDGEDESKISGYVYYATYEY